MAVCRVSELPTSLYIPCLLIALKNKENLPSFTSTSHRLFQNLNMFNDQNLHYSEMSSSKCLPHEKHISLAAETFLCNKVFRLSYLMDQTSTSCSIRSNRRSRQREMDRLAKDISIKELMKITPISNKSHSLERTTFSKKHEMFTNNCPIRFRYPSRFLFMQ